MGDQLTVSKPSDVARDTELFALPRQQGGVTLVFRLRALSLAEMRRLEGETAVIREPGDDNRRLTDEEFSLMRERYKNIARLGIVEPPIAFDGQEEGKASWDDVHLDNQIALMNEIARFSGSGASKDGLEAAALATFPGEPGGADGGDAAGEAVPPGA